MQTDLTIIIKPEEEKNHALIEKKLLRAVSLPIPKENRKFKFIKKSIDARHGNVKYVLKYRAYTSDEEETKTVPEWKKVCDNDSFDKFNVRKSVVIVGSGPAGLFAALKLLENGIKPVIIERGETTDKRKRDIAKISAENVLDEDSNYCFGEGGAGTFSDGKLYTRSNKRGDISSILRIFHHFGADEKILTDAHPHIGTDKLPKIINAIREKIVECGGEFHFNSRVTDLILEGDTPDELVVRGVKVQNVEVGTEIANTTPPAATIHSDAVILATGHSATDIYEMLGKIAPSSLEAKTFAIGVRVEHPRALIDKIQYHGKDIGSAAEYRLATQVDSRGVYSFCMCPGGFVVPSATEKDGIVVNGMSSAKRNSLWSNAAIVVETRPEDIPGEFVEKAEKSGCKALSGLYFRRHLEMLAFENGAGGSTGSPTANVPDAANVPKTVKNFQTAPAQRLLDFLNGKLSSDFPKTSYTPGVVSSRLDKWIPPQIAGRLKTAFEIFGREMKGFLTNDAILIAIETRTSTPVRILRKKETFECPAIKKLFPAGEGSGYSGGIVSSAMDGENAAIAVIKSL